jgi:hypothetical protein
MLTGSTTADMMAAIPGMVTADMITMAKWPERSTHSVRVTSETPP